MSEQTYLPFERRIPPRDPNAAAVDVRRLSGQNLAILNRLRQGSATNSELAAISLKYTSRCSDLRNAGYVVKVKRVAGGMWVYTLG